MKYFFQVLFTFLVISEDYIFTVISGVENNADDQPTKGIHFTAVNCVNPAWMYIVPF